MKRIIYMALTLASALSLGGCSSAITTKDLTMIEEVESQKTEQLFTPITLNLPVVSVDTSGSISTKRQCHYRFHHKIIM